jgi:hypothetical protein
VLPELRPDRDGGRVTPYEIGIMLHYYAHVGDSPERERGAPIWSETLHDFLINGLLEPSHAPGGAVYRITPKGRAFVEALQQVPLPEQVWITRWPTTGVIVDEQRCDR